MSVFTKRVVLSVVAVAAGVGSGAESFAFGCGGGGGRTSGRLSISYSRNVGHMRSHAPRHYAHAQPTYGHVAPQPPVYQQPVYQPQVAPQPLITQPAAPQPALSQPAVQPRIVAQPAIAPQPTVTQPAATQPVAQPAQQSALGALAALGGGATTATIPQFAPAPATQAATHVGSWSATLPGENRVQLLLNANGTFKWTANSRGSVSTFEGVFTVTDGRLTLVRSGDQQQLAGVWLADASGGFRFKLDGQTDNGLLFVRG